MLLANVIRSLATGACLIGGKLAALSAASHWLPDYASVIGDWEFRSM
jgi:hypothetical protein